MFKKKEKQNNEAAQIEALGPWRIAFHRFKKNKIAVAGLILFLIIVVMIIVVPMVSSYGLNDYNFEDAKLSPNAKYILGTDASGRDIFTRLFLGGRISVLVGLIAAAVTVIVGSVIGGIAGFYGGKVDSFLMRISEIISSLPFTPLLIAIASTMVWVPSEDKMYAVMALIGLLSWPGLARLIRGQILSLREQEFMQACEALGLSDSAKIFKHLLPNTLSIIIVNATLQMASAILTEAGLSFLGLGVSEPVPTWGNMANAARTAEYFKDCPWMWLPAGIMILLTVVSINLLGEGLRDAFDPKDIR